MNNDQLMTGAELQALREACGLDRDQFGEKCGVQGRSIKYWEMGASNHGVPADVAALVLELEAKVRKDADAIISHWEMAQPDPVLMRSGNHLQNAANQRAFIELRRRGHDVRMVAFDVPKFKEWAAQTRSADTPGARQQWARLAVKEQAKPHRADQPV